MNDEIKELLGRIYSRAREDKKSAMAKLLREAAGAIEKLSSELVIKESVQEALEKTIHDERSQNSAKMEEINRLRHGLEMILQSDAEQHWDLASYALDNFP